MLNSIMSKPMLWFLLLLEAFGMVVGAVVANFHFYAGNWLVGAVSLGAALGLGWRFMLHITMFAALESSEHP
jgi:hypothetical protein